MKNLLMIALLAFTNIQSSFAEKAISCDENDKVPCQVDAEESTVILNGMLLQNSQFHRLVKKSRLPNPSFDQFRVLQMAERRVSGCGPHTGRSRTVYKIQVVVESTDHGPTIGQEPHLVTTYLTENGMGYYSENQYSSSIKKLGFVNTDINTFPVDESNSPVEEIMKKEIKSPCSKKEGK